MAALSLERPRLALHVQARVHVADGSPHVVLHDPRTRLVARISLDDWRLLREADGTRDLDALCLAAARLGIDPSEEELVRLFSELDEAGLLADGLAPPLREPPVPAPAPPAPETPLEVLPDFTLTCDGRGACCRFYGSVGFAPLEALRARVAAAELALPLADADLFTPLSGAQIDAPDEPRAVALVDGRCAFLDGGARCALHARGGPYAKPAACRIYPAAYVHDGGAVRASLAPECACVFSSVGRPSGAGLVPEGAATYGALDPAAGLLVVPDPVPLSLHRTAPREALRPWSRAVHDVARRADRDAAGWAWALAQAIEEAGALVDPDRAPCGLEAARPWLAAFREAITAEADAQDAHRGASDLSRVVARWAADALARVDPLAAPAQARDEGFYLAALAFGHRLAIEGRPLCVGLRDRATRILVARAMAAVPAPLDPAAAHPLALVEAATRNLGLAGYAPI
ncbi:MAG: YkgJ family cysteine cluster protein [Sandaracinaceae bacterium]|nr:YkgJ family cysteine cluster protein [Sandaracinaceae bacterium]